MLALAMAGVALSMCAESVAPKFAPKPLFRPGLYEAESRDQYRPSEWSLKRICITASDFDAFHKETIAASRYDRRLGVACDLDEDVLTPEGFAFTSNCSQFRIKRVVRFSVHQITDDSVVENTGLRDFERIRSRLQITMRRIGDCELLLTPLK